MMSIFRAIFIQYWMISLLFIIIVKGKKSSLASRTLDESIDFSLASPLATPPIQCEPISSPLCAKMPYNFTRMPNFFKDSSQIEAMERSISYTDLVSTRCSPFVHNYVCELLAPVCLKESREAMKRFEIYPCRSFCRRVRRDCERELSQQLNPAILAAFSCDQLPFESNGGGSGSLSGPCHEAPSLPTTDNNNNESLLSSYIHQSAATSNNRLANYQPFQPQIDSNVPPFITDTSAIDAAHIRPPTLNMAAADFTQRQQPKLHHQQQQQQQQNLTFLNHLQNFAQSVAWTLVKYSNVLSILTLICLVLALNSKRLHKFKNYLTSSSSSSSSSSCPRHEKKSASILLAGGGGGEGGGGGIGSGLSPSSSARSLVLVAGTGKSANHSQQPTHQLLSHQLSGTLEHQRLKGAGGTRYHLTGPFNSPAVGDKQQLFTNTLDSQSSSNQYDYIQVQSHTQHSPSLHHQSSPRMNRQQQQQQQQQQQLYSNILLSSPSHQVLLVGGNTSTATSQQQQQQQQQQQHLGRSALPSQQVNTRHPSYSSARGNSLLNGYERSFQRRTVYNQNASSPGRSFARASCSSSSSSGSARSPPDLRRL